MSLEQVGYLCSSLLILTLVCWMLAWRRHKIGVDAACNRHTCSEFTVVVRLFFILATRKWNTARQLHPVTTGLLSDYDKRVADS